MYRYLLFLPLLLLGTSIDTEAENLETFVQRAVPEGGIFSCGTVRAGEVTYALFLLRQHERRGILIVAQSGAAQPQVACADSALDIATGQGSIPAAVIDQFVDLLGLARPLQDTQTETARGGDICPVGAALNEVLTPIAGFSLRTNSTLGILRELEQSDAIPVEPSQAPIGTVLVSPATYSSNGPVLLGSVGIVGLDGRVYEPDSRRAGAWSSFGNLKDWVRQNGAAHQVFGFLLRAHPQRTH